ncbi:hypothetical protein HanPI659440_Chr07g0253531 [Helianthus annuus]|nr:hypothetical protein HanPI659440_Chr07g0253531 [Helianthus annuus]
MFSIIFLLLCSLYSISHLAGEMKRLKELVIDAKNENIGVVPLFVNNMLERNLFLYRAVNLKEGSVAVPAQR